jgi:hypothetical protein
LNATDPLGLSIWNPCSWGNACHHLHNVADGARHQVARASNAVKNSSVEHLAVDAFLQDEAYLACWTTYVAIEKAKQLGSHVPGGKIAAEVVTAPLVPIEAAGLGGQERGSLAKGESVYLEDQPGQPLFGHQLGGVGLSEAADSLFGTKRFMQMNFPGPSYINHRTDFQW